MRIFAGFWLLVASGALTLSWACGGGGKGDSLPESTGAMVTTLAGLASPTGGSANGTGATAGFYLPTGIAVDGSGNIYVGDTFNNTIRKITPTGAVSTIAGAPGLMSGPNGFYGPCGVAVNQQGSEVYVADSNDETIRQIVLSSVYGGAPDWFLSILAGTTQSPGNADGRGTAKFSLPDGVALDGSGNLYVADSGNCTIRKISSDGTVSAWVGTARNVGSADGLGGAASFNNPFGLAVDGAMNVYVADTFNHTIRKITPAGEVSTLAGLAGTIGSVDGMGAAARFNYPHAVAVDGSGNVYVADSYNETIRKITPQGLVSTIAGSAGLGGSADGQGSDARFNDPQGLAVDGSGIVYVADSGNNTIRKITPP